MIQTVIFYAIVFADVAYNSQKFCFEGLAMAVRLKDLLNPMLEFRTEYASSLSYGTTLEVLSD